MGSSTPFWLATCAWQKNLRRYHADALINGLTFDRHAEEIAVSAFSKGINLARHRFLEDPLGAPLIPDWNRMITRDTRFLNLLNSGC